MEILILGGTRFLGIHLTDVLRSRGHRVTHFTRGTIGDRRTDLARLGTRTWDAVIDTSGYTPLEVEISSRYFAQRTGRYLFVSTISVYDTMLGTLDEDSPTLPMLGDGDYGALKAACERIVASTFRERATIVRPGLIVGPYDNTDRFTAWPLRFERGGDVLVPESPSYLTQFIDARDVAEFIAHLLERNASGVYNTSSPVGRYTLGSVFDACIHETRVASRLCWSTPEFLESQGIGGWIDMPLWIPASMGIPGMLNVDVRRAFTAGLTLRPLDRTISETLAWTRTWPRERLPIAGLSPERERSALEAFYAAADVSVAIQPK